MCCPKNDSLVGAQNEQTARSKIPVMLRNLTGNSENQFELSVEVHKLFQEVAACWKCCNSKVARQSKH
jgi:hypothetical protein